MDKKKLYGLLAALALVLVAGSVGLYAAFGSGNGDTSGNGSKPGQSEQKDNEESLAGTEVSLPSGAGSDSPGQDAAGNSSSRQGQDEDEGEIIVRPSQEADAPEEPSKNPENNDSGSGDAQQEGGNGPQTENTEQPESSGQPKENDVIELPFVPID